MSARITGVLLVVFVVCCSNSVVLLDKPGISKYLNTLFLLNSHLCASLEALSVMYQLPE